MSSGLIIDGCTCFGADPTGRTDCSLDTLRRVLDRHGIDRACVYSLLAVRMDVRQGNDEAVTLAGKDSRFLPVAVLDPRHVETGAVEVKRCLQAGVRLFRLFPDAHGYPWRYEPLIEIWEALQDHRLALIAPELGSGGLTEFAQATSGHRFTKILEGCRYTTFTEYLAVTRRYPGTYLMAIGMATPGALEAFVKAIGSDRICFGSKAPINYVGAGLAVVERGDLSQQEKADILGATLARLLGEPV